MKKNRVLSLKQPNKDRPINLEKKCFFCSNIFFSSLKKAKFCSRACKLNHRKTLSLKTFGLSSNNIGAMSELIAAAYLMKNGFEVHRSVSPNAKFDLVGFNKNQLFLFEVKTGTYGKSGNILWPKKKHRNANFIVVTQIDAKVWLFPDFKEMIRFEV